MCLPVLKQLERRFDGRLSRRDPSEEKGANPSFLHAFGASGLSPSEPLQLIPDRAQELFALGDVSLVSVPFVVMVGSHGGVVSWQSQIFTFGVM